MGRGGLDSLPPRGGEAARRCKIIFDSRCTDDARPPAHAGANQKAFLCWNVFKNLAKRLPHPSGGRHRLNS